MLYVINVFLSNFCDCKPTKDGMIKNPIVGFMANFGVPNLPPIPLIFSRRGALI